MEAFMAAVASRSLSEWAANVSLSEPLILHDCTGPKDSIGSKASTQAGPPLFVACVLDEPDVVRFLLSAGADPNQSGGDHGDTPLLHCSAQGYDECLALLLECPRTNMAAALTTDYKVFLGQALPVYKAGGENPLHLTVDKGRVSTARLLLQHGSDIWLRQSDTFGRTPLDAACEQLVLTRSESSEMHACLTSLVRLLAEAQTDSPPETEEAIRLATPVSMEAARAAQAARQQIVRERWLRSQDARREQRCILGLTNVATRYRPLHADVYREKWWSNRTQQQHGQHCELAEPIPGVLVASGLVPADLCHRLWDELLHYERTATEQPELELPVMIRHDGNIGNLQDCGFTPVLKEMEQAVNALRQQHDAHARPCRVHHAFLTRNWVGRDQASFRMHCDQADITFNLCIHASSDLVGSTVGFFQSPPDDQVGSIPDDAARQFTLAHQVGQAVIHTGQHWHRTDPLTRGTRASLIVWARLE